MSFHIFCFGLHLAKLFWFDLVYSAKVEGSQESKEKYNAKLYIKNKGTLH